MQRPLRASILITCGLFILCIISGCGDEDPPEEVKEPPQPEYPVQPPRAITVEVDPPPGPDIDHDFTEFTFRFSEEVVVVTVNGTTATGSGRNWSLWAYHLPLGGQSLTIEWKNRDGSTGSKVAGYYTLVHFQHDAPSIWSGTVADGAVDVDPAPINAGGFRFDFDELVTGTIKLTDEAGADLNWIANVVGQTATLTAVAGQELVNETTYKIEINVQDGFGFGLQTTITFVTKPK